MMRAVQRLVRDLDYRGSQFNSGALGENRGGASARGLIIPPTQACAACSGDGAPDEGQDG